MAKGEEPFTHPYIPNAVPETRARLLSEVGASRIEELYAVIPPELRLDRLLDLPPPLRSELALRRHVEGLLTKNRSCKELLSFLGAGCWQHYVPAVCDEISSRAEFLTAYSGATYSDLGKFQAIFEYQSMMGELVGMEVVSTPIYDWAASASSSALMAVRLTGRTEILVPGSIAPDRLAHMRNCCLPVADLVLVDYDPTTGLLDMEDLKAKLTPRVAAVYHENPSYFGVIESQGSAISSLAHTQGALAIVGVDAVSLGILAAPADYGADIVCGEAQGLGIHMQYGGGQCGFVATADKPEYVAEYPSMLVSIAPGHQDEGEWGFGMSTMWRTSYNKREEARDYTGTTQWLWGITAGVYLALMGPQGMSELGEAIMHKSHYAMQRLSQIDGVKVPLFSSVHFKEFIVTFDIRGRKVSEINKALLERGILGGKDLSAEFPELGNSALYCVTEAHTQEDIERLTVALQEVLRR